MSSQVSFISSLSVLFVILVIMGWSINTWCTYIQSCKIRSSVQTTLIFSRSCSGLDTWLMRRLSLNIIIRVLRSCFSSWGKRRRSSKCLFCISSSALKFCRRHCCISCNHTLHWTHQQSQSTVVMHPLQWEPRHISQCWSTALKCILNWRISSLLSYAKAGLNYMRHVCPSVHHMLVMHQN